MRKPGALLGLTIIILSPTAGLSTLWNGVGLAAAKCITEPNLDAPHSGHWYFHTDPVSDRKCWYIGRPGSKHPRTTPAESALKIDSHVRRTTDVGRPKNNEATDQSDARLNGADRDALFQEFLRWQERQNQPDSSPDKAARDALFRDFLVWQALQDVEPAR